MTTFGQRLRSRREERGISRMDAASHVGRHLQTIVKWESAESAPKDIDAVYGLANLLGVSFEWLAFGVRARRAAGD